MGGLLGDLVGGFFRAYLNSVGAGLFCAFLLLLAVSLSTRISVRDLALHTWLILSAMGVRIIGAAFYAGMQIWSMLSQAYGEVRPKLSKQLVSGWKKWTELARARKEKREALAASKIGRAHV